MKIVGFSGSPRSDGNTDRLVKQVLAGAAEAGAQTAFFRIADASIKGCVACYHCRPHGVCALHDDMAPLLAQVFAADVVVLGTPIYMGQMSGQTKVFVDRLLPVLGPNFITRLKQHPGLFGVYTQGHSDPAAFRAYMEETSRFLAFLGFVSRGFLAAVGTRERDDIEKQAETLAQARAAGADLARGAV
jgi:multimeric flavodoxin WrbA